MEVTHGGIYLYEPPFISTSPNAAIITASGSEQSGLRPWIIVSQNVVNVGKQTAVGVPLTTKVKKANAHRIFLPSSELISDIGCTPFQDSVALCDHVRVLDLNQIRKKIGNVTENALLAVGLGLAYVFDIR